MSRLLISLVVLFLFVKSHAQEKIAKRIYTTQLLKTPIVIDGDLSDAGWDTGTWASDFVEKMPDEGTPPTFQTQFKVLYDAQFLYVAIRAFDDRPGLIQQRLTRRDGFAGDRVNVIIDSYLDKRTAFVFTTTAAGVKGEEIVTQNGNKWDDSWNPIWYTNAKIDANGWTAEMKIPFSQLRFGNDTAQIWGFNVSRNIFRENERSLWQRIPNDQAGFISESGELHGLINLKSQKQLEIQPFTVLQYDKYQAEAGNPYKDGRDFKINGGLDAKIGITNDLTLDLTVNPDFGQVEADPGAIALDGFQIFFEEQRPFFVENKNIFDFKFANGRDNLFYSRRIGGSPNRTANLAAGEFANEPLNATILGAAKFSGKTKNGWSIGVLESVTANEFSEIKQVDGQRRKEIVAPLTNYFVGRAQKDFNKRNSFIGGIVTATNRDLAGNFSELHKAAYTAGIDFQHNWKNRDYYFEGNTILSHVKGSKTAILETQQFISRSFQRIDATHVNLDPNRTSLTGTGGRVEVGKKGGGNWRYNGGFVWRSPELELNDIGFLRQTDEMIQYSELRYLWQVPTKIYRNIELRLEQNTAYDFGGNLNKLSTEFRARLNWLNNWDTNIGFGTNSNVYENSFLRGGPRWHSPNNYFLYTFVGSDETQKFSFRLGYVQSKSQEEVFKSNRYVFRTNYQPFDAFSISLDTEFRKTTNKAQYVTKVDFDAEKRYVLGKIDNETWTTTLRMNYSLSPNFSFQFYGQPFIARGRYADFKYVNTPTASRFEDRVNEYNTNQLTAGFDADNNAIYSIDETQNSLEDYRFKKPDFSFAQLQTNLVVRWEYIPGSELFFVWARGGSDSGNPENSLGSSLQNQIFEASLQDTFVIKATYRFVR
ncbi:MAG: DUF5916 domain-containing protein [Polaribacter sp.]|nr:DUF5916 domain-containing protein [Polaribacter sp.]